MNSRALADDVHPVVLVAPFIRPAGGVGDTPPLPYYLYCLVGIAIMIVGVIWWTLWQVVPTWFGYQFLGRKEKLEDGTVVTLVSRFLITVLSTMINPLQFSLKKTE